MATTDTRSGFRLPWSSDRAHDDPEGTDAPDGAVDDAGEQAAAAQASAPWPDIDIESRPSFPSEAHRPAAGTPASAPGANAPRKPTKLMVDLAAAIRATTEQARDQRLGQLETEAGNVVELIRARSTEGASALRRRADDDVAAIKEWAKAEIARIREESESRIGDRKHLLEREIEGHTAAIEDRVGVVESAVGDYRARINAYFERMAREDDPARLATMAEGMPEPPSLELLVELEAPEPVSAPAPDTEPAVADEPVVTEADPVTTAVAPEPASDAVDAATASPWPETPDAWTDTSGGPEAPAADGWDAPAHAEGEPADREAIMAALEADAEAVVAAEAAAGNEEPDDVAAGTAEPDDELDPEAQAAIAARVDAIGNESFETASYAERLAGLLPASAEVKAAEGETSTTQVGVTGLVSVASIASFKRHLGRLAGVTSVAVASGPDGGFIFNVTHRPDVSLRDAIPTLPGFAARVTSSADGVVSVTARDPETEA